MTTDSVQNRSLNYAVLYGGVTAAIFGLILLVRREEAIGLLMVLLGIWWLIYGAFMLFAVFVDKSDWGWQLFLGTLGVAAGLIALSRPVDSAAALGAGLAVVLGALGLIIGVAAIVGSFQGGGAGALVFGLVSAAIGVLFIFNPLDTAQVTVTVLAVLLLVNGVAGIGLALRYR